MITVHSHATLLGSRDCQEDNYRLGGRFAALADGMGGHADGDKAAKKAIEAAVHSSGDLSIAMKAAAQAVSDLAPYAESIRDMPGTTLVIAHWGREEDKVTICSVGDSKVYIHRGEETRMVAGFRDSNPDGSLAACLGAGFSPDKVYGHLDIVDMVPGDKLILTTDGCDKYFDFFIDLEGGVDAARVVNESERLSGPKADNATCVILECS